MEEWVTLQAVYASEKEARKVAGIVEITESRLLSLPGGPQYDIETEVFEDKDGWKIRWKRVPAAARPGCSSCSSCGNNGPAGPKKKPAKVLQFKPRNN
ncbi:MAG: hypothetical protein CVU89_12215 [Firmicutes bacterium HGW-Firmicutes-14]|nr:MAG: hypothetical protein CVU89_12215 [Firmicutes bacterium HGW-Firmicutes-14]